MDPSDDVRFLQQVLPQLHLEWSGFRKVRGQAIKRIRGRMRELALTSLEDYRAYLADHPDEWRVLDQLCRITISRFWRDREVFDQLRDHVLPALAADRPRLTCWSAGCASGEEPYSVVLAWHFGQASTTELQILATDADEAMLERARRAVYSRGTLRELLPSQIDGAFLQRDHELALRPDLKDRVELAVHDLRLAPPARMFSLILCRNIVLTYFDSELRERVLAAILDHLEPGGALVIGIHETIPPALKDRLSPWPGTRAIYRLDAC